CFEVIEGRILLSHFVNFAGLSAPTYTVTFDEVPLRENDPLLDQYVSYGVKFDDPGIMFDPDPGFEIGLQGNHARNAFQIGVGAIGDPKTNPFSIFFTSDVSAAAVAAQAGYPVTRFTALLDGVDVESFTAASDMGGNAGPFYGFTGIVFNEIR